VQAEYDLAIVGGGINGCGIARDAAGRGLSVVLLEQDDLASGTSSASTKLIHGGLRYLEYLHLRLVREALQEREALMRIAPHIIWPLRFVLPLRRGMRSPWLIRLGLLLYDSIGGRKLLPATRRIDLERDEAGKPLAPEFKRAFEFSDCWVDDARLVVLNAADAAAHGADILTRTRFVSAKREAGRWLIECEATHTRRGEKFTAKVLVNAAGPWVRRVSEAAQSPSATPIRLVQGSHIVVPKIFDHARCYFFQNSDQRVLFAIPYQRDFTLLGTTDRDYTGDPAHPLAAPEEIQYLCEQASAYFKKRIEPIDVVWSYSGVRPLYDDGASAAKDATRDYVLEFETEDGRAPLLNIVGGKITTYRKLAEAALEKLSEVLPHMRRSGWTAGAPLPGGDFDVGGFDQLVTALRADFPYLEAGHARRLIRLYGTRARQILEGSRSKTDLGAVFGAELTEREVIYLMDHEWARMPDDILWRRTKLGLRFSEPEKIALRKFMLARHQLANTAA
jgi:glycerol-3-phosphate dehydrogenase